MMSYVQKIFARYKIFCILLLIFAGVVAALLLFAAPENRGGVLILKSYSDRSDIDSDGDGVPDWQEEVVGSDILNASSFPYQKDIAQAKNISVDDLLYGGPGEFTEEIVRRFLLDTKGTVTVTPEEREQFITVSVEYFINQIEKRGLPPVRLNIDTAASRRGVLNGFLGALKRFSDERKSVDTLTLEVFAKNTGILPDARKMRAACDYTLSHIPRDVPEDVYDSYYLVLETLIYRCEALSLALSDPSAENYFYTLKLLSTGRLFENVENVSQTTLQNKFLSHVSRVITLLE